METTSKTFEFVDNLNEIKLEHNNIEQYIGDYWYQNDVKLNIIEADMQDVADDYKHITFKVELSSDKLNVNNISEASIWDICKKYIEQKDKEAMKKKLSEGYYFKWSGANMGGTFHITYNTSLQQFKYEQISGSAIPTDTLVGFLWYYPGLADMRKAMAAPHRKNSWCLDTYNGVSGCVDYYISYMTDKGIVRHTSAIIHASMNDKQNCDIKCWGRDLMDTLWAMKQMDIFHNAFEPEYDDGIGFVDITERINHEAKLFSSKAWNAFQGYNMDDEVDEDTIDYSNYTPVEK